MKRASVGIVAIMAITLLTAPGYQLARAGPQSTSVEMVHAWFGEPVNLNPLVANEGLAWTFNMLLFDGLVELDENNIPQPALAERWIVSPDGLRYTFFLRKDATWHDGTPFTADDVAFTIYSHLNPNVISSWYRNYEALVGFEQLTNRTNPVLPQNLPVKPVVVLDKHTVVFRLRFPYAPFLSILQTYRGGMVPKHLLEGKNINEAELNKRPIGTGRFRLVEWRPGERMVFEANEKYYRGRPRIDRLVVRIMADRGLAVEELRKGTVHFVFAPPIELLPSLERLPGVETIFKAAIAWSGIMLNLRNELFQDRRIRQALVHAIDRQTLSKAVYGGKASPATGPIAPGHGSWAFNSQIKPYEYSPERAKRILAEAGWVPGPDGVLQKGGKRFSFALVGIKQAPMDDAVVFVQEQWRRVGVEAKIELLARAAWVEKVRVRRDFEATFEQPAGWPDPDPITTNHFHSKGPLNIQAYANPRIDELLERGRRLVTIKERGPVYHELAKLLHEDAPWVWLMWAPAHESWSTKFKGYSGGGNHPVGSYYTLHKVEPVK